MKRLIINAVREAYAKDVRTMTVGEPDEEATKKFAGDTVAKF